MPLNSGVFSDVRVEVARDVSVSSESVSKRELRAVVVEGALVLVADDLCVLCCEVALLLGSGAFLQICCGPTPARNATTRFCPLSPLPPQASCMGSTMDWSERMHDCEQSDAVKSLTAQPDISEV